MKTYIKTPERRNQLLVIACKLAEINHFRHVTRRGIAEAAKTSTGNVSRVFGTMEQMRTDLIEYAIKHNQLIVVAQAIIDKHPSVKNINENVKIAALKSVI